MDELWAASAPMQSVMEPIPTVMVLPALAVALVVFLLVARWWGNRMYAVAGAVALVGHVAVGALVVPRVPYDWDIARFHVAALEVLETGVPTFDSTVESFGSIVAGLYAVFGPDPAIITVLNGLCAVLVVIPVVVLARTLYPADGRPVGALMLAILYLPLPFFFLSIPMRDALGVVLFLSGLAILAWGITARHPAGLLAAVPLAALFPLRPELVAVAAIGAVVASGIAVARAVGGPRVFAVGAVLSAGAGLVAAAGAAVSLWGDPLEAIGAAQQARAYGGAVYLPTVGYDSWPDLVLAAPIRAVYFQFAPFPHHVDAVFDLIALSGLPLLVVIAVAALRSLGRRPTDASTVALLVTVYVTGVVGYGLVDSNFGTTVRHRIPFVFLLLVFAAPVLRRWERALRRRFGVPPGDRSDDGRGSEEPREPGDGLRSGR